jgi:hypothetical protein
MLVAVIPPLAKSRDAAARMRSLAPRPLRVVSLATVMRKVYGCVYLDRGRRYDRR